MRKLSELDYTEMFLLVMAICVGVLVICVTTYWAVLIGRQIIMALQGGGRAMTKATLFSIAVHLMVFGVILLVVRHWSLIPDDKLWLLALVYVIASAVGGINVALHRALGWV